MSTAKRLAVLIAIVVVTGLPPKAASAQLVFPHIADGGGYKTILLLTNGTDTSTTATISLFSDSGEPLTVTVGTATSSSFEIPIQARGSIKITTSGNSATATTGWAQVTTSPSVSGLSGNAVFQLFNGSSLFSEACVPAAEPGNSADFYADEEGGFNTGFAMTNPGMVAAAGTLLSRKANGVIAGTYRFTLPPGRHLSAFLFQIIPGAPSGRIEISLTAGAVSVTALRFHSSSIFSAVSVGQPGPSINALFSPNGGVRSRIVSEINKAASTIDVAIYSFTAEELCDALIAARNRGVAVRIIADSSQATSSSSKIAALEQLGFSVRRMAGLFNGIMHNKYMILDGKSLFTGSYNWSLSAEDSNYENAIFIQGSSVVQSYISDFNKLWAK